MTPNILFILCDQLRADVLGSYGNLFVRTPAIDRLASRGTVFESAYATSPVCVPSRASMITGFEPQSIDCYENGSDMPAHQTFMSRLTDHGYRTHGVGKMHFTPDSQAMMGFQTRDRGEEFGTVEEDDYLAFVAANGFDHVEHPHGLRDEMYYVPQLSPVPEDLHFSHWVTDRSINFLQSVGDDPFLLWASYIAPHPPFAPPAPWHRLYEPSLMPDPFEPEDAGNLLTVYNRLQNRYKYRDGGRDRRLWQLIRSYYYASVSYVDFQIGRLLDELQRSGKADNTLVVLTSDHGEFLGDYGVFGKRSFLDASSRVPLICAGPGFEVRREDAPVSLVDLFPTFVAAAHAGDVKSDGLPLQQPVQERTVFGQYQQGELGMFAVITRGWKYVWSAPDRREILLDRIADPLEARNLAYNVRVRETLVEMRAIARAHFRDLAEVDFDAESGNVPLVLGSRPSPDALRSLRSLAINPEASTMVVRGGAWAAPPAGYSTRSLPVPRGEQT